MDSIHLLKYLSRAVSLSIDHRHSVANHLEPILPSQAIDQARAHVDPDGSHQRVYDGLRYDASDLVNWKRDFVSRGAHMWGMNVLDSVVIGVGGV
jgi:hypothetical protein